MRSRSDQLSRLQGAPLDILIVGGGVNGAGTLRDLALRNSRENAGLRLGLLEKNYFSSGTSGKNSHLIHGGLRYLKNLEFGLVQEALRERATLLKIAPDLVWPQPFLLPFYSRWDTLQYRAGLTIYDTLAGRALWPHPHRRLTREETLTQVPGLNAEHLKGAAVFYDCRVHSARLVLENLWEAERHGAAVLNYAEVESWTREGELWRVVVRDHIQSGTFTVTARYIIDARGAWSDPETLRLVRGSHIVVPALFPGDTAVSYFGADGRIIFFLPWFGQTLVGTTDVDHPASPDAVHISNEEVAYLQRTIKTVFPESREAEPLAAFSSLRPLVKDIGATSATKTSREHKIFYDSEGVLRITGGKYTTYRLMSEQATDLILRNVAPALDAIHLTATTPIEGNSSADMQLMVSPQLSDLPAQLAFAVEHEMARHLADVLYVSTLQGYQHHWTAEALLPLARQLAGYLGRTDADIQHEIQSTLTQ